jgi:C1A family cysteine protease
MSQEELLALQRAIQGQDQGWTAGTTSLSALPLADQARRLGLRLEPQEVARIAAMMAEPSLRAAEYPPACDWRNVEGTDWTTPIRDQQACGACVAFGTVGVLETMLKRYYSDAQLQPDLSEAHLFFCGCGECCEQGWWPTYALDYARDSGVPDEACFPYQDQNLACSQACDDWQSRAVRVTSWKEVIDVAARKEWLATKGPVVGCMAVYKDFFSYKSGVYHYTMGDLAGYHAICVVGYADAEQAWICKNSWGEGWGASGWFKIGYGECGIDTQFAMYGVEAVTPGSDPSPEPEPEPQPTPGCNVWNRIVSAWRGLWQ